MNTWRAHLLPLLLSLAAALGANRQKLSTAAPVTLPGCPDKCGEVSIPYPFGTKDGCFLPDFEIICNHSFDPPRAFFAAYDPAFPSSTYNPLIGAVYSYYSNDEPLRSKSTITSSSSSPIELTGVSVGEGRLRVRASFSYDCKPNKTYHSARDASVHFRPHSPFLLSEERTVLMGLGRSVEAHQEYGPACQAASGRGSFRPPVNGTCAGRGCCQAAMPPQLSNTMVTIELDRNDYSADCSYAMLVDKDWYNFTSLDLDGDAFLRRNDAGGVPVVVDFVVGSHSCPRPGQPGYACASNNSVCVQVPFYNGQGYFCRCLDGYQGNPYIPTGCQDIDECERPDLYPCHWTCQNREGGYRCSCPAGTRGNATEGRCTEIFPLPAKVSVGAIGGLFVVALLVFFVLLRREKRKMRQFFEKNGGPALEKVQNIKIYKREELKPIIKGSNFIGKGCFGEVYMGFLDNQQVAVKKPITDSVAQNDQFANEVIIQSQVIHKNIVRLIGCCLEVDIPMLVYEFLSKGSLDDILHNENNKVALDLDVRLNIAAESADALAYMHSKTGKTILHGDVKPANILLDDNYVPKISDFGISRLIARDKEHAALVIGDRTYMDPVYMQTGLLTEKSDVYSFGVVLLELVSGRKATYLDNNSLVRNFLDAQKKEKMPIDLFDKQFHEARDLELLSSLTMVSMECLNLDVGERPAMTDVAERLLTLKRSRMQS